MVNGTGALGLAAAFIAGAKMSRQAESNPLLSELQRRYGELAMETAARTARAEILPPELDVQLDEKRFEPRMLVNHPCPTLQYVVTPDTMKDGVLRVFTRPEATLEYARDVQERFKKEPAAGKRFGSLAQRGAGQKTVTPRALTQGYYGTVGGYIDLFEHANYQGSRWTFWADWGTQRDFRSVFCFLWWCTNINDRVSSADCYVDYLDGNIPYDAYTILFEHINLGGAALWLWAGAAPGGPGLYPNLGMYGWNDVASSMRYF